MTQNVEYVIDMVEVAIPSVSKAPKYEQKGVAYVVRYQFSCDDFTIIYDKYHVEGIKYAEKMQLEGYELNNQLVKGSGIVVLSKTWGSGDIYGEKAESIIEKCEEVHKEELRKCFNQLEGKTK